MKKAALALLVGLGAAALAWALWPAAELEHKASAPSAAAGVQGRALPTVDELLSGAQPSSALDAGAVVLQGTVFTPSGEPAVDAEVDVLPQTGAPSVIAAVCGECGQPLLQCESPDTAAQVAQAVRQARGTPVPLATTRTDAQGHFVLPLQWEGAVVVRATDRQTRQAWDVFDTDSADTELSLTLAERTQIHGQVVTEERVPVAGARVLMVATSDGTHVEAVSDGEGAFTALCPAEPCALWTFTEAEGFAPLVVNAGGLNAEDNVLSIELSRARDLEVVTRLAGKPIDATLTVTVDGHKKVVQAHGGTARLEKLGVWEINVEASANGFTSGDRAVSLNQPHNKVAFDLRATSRALLEVLGHDGTPLPDVSVSLDGPDARAEGQSGDDGALLVLGPLGEGTYQLTATTAEGISKTLEVDLSPGDNPITVTLPAAQYLQGRLVNADGKVAPPTVVTASFGPHVHRETSDPETGEFKFAVGESGPWQLVADSATEGRAALKASAPAAELVLRFDRRAGIEVRVTAEGKPAADVLVAVMPELLLGPRGRLRRRVDAELAMNDEGRLQPMVHQMSAVADESGTVKIWGLEPGPVVVRVADQAFRPAVKKVTLVEGRLVELQLELEKGATIQGEVVDAQGKALNGSEVSLTVTGGSNGEGMMGRAVEDDGRFSMPGLEAGKSYTLSARTDEALSADVKVQAPARGVRLVLAPLPRVMGRVVDPAGGPVSHFEIDGRAFDHPDGRFEIAATPGPEVSFFVVAEGFRSKLVELPAAGDAGDIALQRAQDLRGRVVNGRGEPVPGAVVSCEPCTDGTTGVDGSFELKLDEVDYPLVVRAARGAVSGMTRLVGPTELVVKLGPKTRIVGHSWDLAGRPAPGIVLARLTNGGALERMTAGGDGRFAAELAQGVWEFQTLSGEFVNVVTVTGDEVDVELGGAPGTCSLRIAVPQNSDVRVLLKDKAHEGASSWISDDTADGALTRAGLACGPWSVTFYSPGLEDPRLQTMDLELRDRLTEITAPVGGAPLAGQ